MVSGNPLAERMKTAMETAGTGVQGLCPSCPARWTVPWCTQDGVVYRPVHGPWIDQFRHVGQTPPRAARRMTFLHVLASRRPVHSGKN